MISIPRVRTTRIGQIGHEVVAARGRLINFGQACRTRALRSGFVGHHGVAEGAFTSAQARAAGYSDARIRRMLRRGEWVPLRRGVYVDASTLAGVAGDDEREHALAVAGGLLTVHRNAVAAGTSAARILALPLLDPPPSDLVLASEDATASGQRDGYVLRSTTLPRGHCAFRHGVAITSAARTVVDLARESGFSQGVVAADAALHRGQVSPSHSPKSSSTVTAGGASTGHGTLLTSLMPRASPLSSRCRGWLSTCKACPRREPRSYSALPRGPSAGWTSCGRTRL